MNILVFADYPHNYGLPECKPDVVFLLGDIDFYDVKKISQTYDCQKFGVIGNHDGPDFLRDFAEDIHGKVVNFNGLKIAGFGGSPRYNSRKYGQYTEDEVETFTKDLEQVDIFLAHSNPQRKVTTDVTDAHRGFVAFTNYIQKKSPQYFFHGHLHENDEYQIGETKILSVYPVKLFKNLI